MANTTFDLLTRELAAAGTRRGLLRVLAVLGFGGALALLGADDEAAAERPLERVRDRAKRRQQRHQNRDDKGKGGKPGNGGNGGNGKGKGGKRPPGSGGTPCDSPADCDPGQTCHFGKCGVSCGDKGFCAAGSDAPDCCEGSCVDTGTDRRNCGTCGATCDDGMCFQGQCVACDVCDGCTFKTLQAAVDGSNPGDTVRICPGTTPGRAEIGKNLTLTGVTPNRNQTVLNGKGDGDGPILTIDQGANVAVWLLTLADATSKSGPAAIQNAGTLLLRRVDVSNNTATGKNARGGAIANLAAGTLTVENCAISGNSATNNGMGGGLYNAGTATLSQGTLTDNQATYGGGIGQDRSGATLTLQEGSDVSHNTSSQGGGVFSGQGCALTVSASSIANNLAKVDNSGGGGSGDGGGILNFQGTVTLSDASSVTKNTAQAKNGLDKDRGPGGGIFNFGQVQIQGGSTVQNNSPDDCVNQSKSSKGCPA